MLVGLAVGKHRPGQRRPVQWEVPEYETHLARVDKAGLDLRKHFVVEDGAVRARERGVLDDLVRGVGVTENLLQQGLAGVLGSCRQDQEHRCQSGKQAHEKATP